MAESQEIILDCAPGMIRPGDLLPSILLETGIEPVEASSKIFGSWVFEFHHIDASVWEANITTIAERIRALFDQGIIRYGSWWSFL